MTRSPMVCVRHFNQVRSSHANRMDLWNMDRFDGHFVAYQEFFVWPSLLIWRRGRI
jgi:hypothetical protein